MGEKYGPLYHRNGAKLLPLWFTKITIAIAVLIIPLEFILGLLSVVK